MAKKIHQIWIQGKKHFRENQPEYYSYHNLWDKYFPDWEYIFWSEEDYISLIERYSSKLLEVYKNAPNKACQCDIARLIILYYHGGFYIDIDYEPFRNFAYLVNGSDLELVLVGMNLCKSKIYFGGYKYSNAWIYAKKKCKYISILLNRILRTPYTDKYTKFDYTWNITGPGALTKMVEELKLDSKDDVRILDHSLIEVADFSKTNLTRMNKEEILERYPFAVGIHRMNASWVDNADVLKELGKIYSFYNEYHDFIGILSVIVIIFLIIIIIYLVWFNKINNDIPISNNSINSKMSMSDMYYYYVNGKNLING